MDISNAVAQRVFFTVHSNLPREGPGNRACTLKALDIADPQRRSRVVVDVACGPGMQTFDLAAALPEARILALDLHSGYLPEVATGAANRHLGNRLLVARADMRALPVADASLDLIWCEGAAYIMGFEAALHAWAPLLRNGGRIALTEAVWLKDNPPERVRLCWEEYPALTDMAGCQRRINRAGMRLIDSFVLPDEAWWEHYYAPMRARVTSIAPDFAGDPVADAVLRECREEIDVFEAYSAYYGYVFFVVEKAR